MLHTFPIVGAHFRPPAKAILQVLPLDTPLKLQPEPTNPYDANAVRVIVESKDIPAGIKEDLDLRARGFGFSADEIYEAAEWHLGYIPKEIAAEWQERFPPEGFPAQCTCLPDGKPAVKFTEA